MIKTLILVDYDKDFNKIKFSSNRTNLSLGKLLHFPTLTVVIRCVIKKGDIFYSQAYLEDFYYKNMIIYKSIDCSEGIGLDKSEESIKCMICNYYYFKDTGFKYQPYVCIGCHDFSMKIMELSDFFILNVCGNDYMVYIANIDKEEAANILSKSDLVKKEYCKWNLDQISVLLM